MAHHRLRPLREVTHRSVEVPHDRWALSRRGFPHDRKKIREEKRVTEGTGPDERAFKPRAGVTIAVGGSSGIRWAASAGLFMLPLQIAVVDDIVVNWVGWPRTSLSARNLERAHRAGRQVVRRSRRLQRHHRATTSATPTLSSVPSKMIEVPRFDVYPCICGMCGVRGTLSVTDGKSLSPSRRGSPHSSSATWGKSSTRRAGQPLAQAAAGMETLAGKTAKYNKYLTPLKPPARDKGGAAGE